MKKLNNKGEALAILTISVVAALITNAAIQGTLRAPQWHKERTVDVCKKGDLCYGDTTQNFAKK